MMKILNTKDESRQIITGPSVAVDSVLFVVEQDQLKVLLIKIKSGPYKEMWALPGGLVGLEETLDDAAQRVLFQKTNVKDIYLEQLCTFGDTNRDIRGRSVSVAYFALVNNLNSFKIKTTPFYSEIAWFPIKALPAMAFDHEEIINYAWKRLKAKVGYSNIVYSLLPEEFTLTEMQRVYEIILGEPIDKRNFRKRILSLGMVEVTGKRKEGDPHRPAKLFHFSKRELVFN